MWRSYDGTWQAPRGRFVKWWCRTIACSRRLLVADLLCGSYTNPRMSTIGESFWEELWSRTRIYAVLVPMTILFNICVFINAAISLTVIVIGGAMVGIMVISTVSSRSSRDEEDAMKFAVLIGIVLFAGFFFHILAAVSVFLGFLALLSLVAIGEFVTRWINRMSNGGELCLGDWHYRLLVLSVIGIGGFVVENWALIEAIADRQGQIQFPAFDQIFANGREVLGDYVNALHAEARQSTAEALIGFLPWSAAILIPWSLYSLGVSFCQRLSWI